MTLTSSPLLAQQGCRHPHQPPGPTRGTHWAALNRPAPRIQVSEPKKTFREHPAGLPHPPRGQEGSERASEVLMALLPWKPLDSQDSAPPQPLPRAAGRPGLRGKASEGGRRVWIGPWSQQMGLWSVPNKAQPFLAGRDIPG